jgi:hypothetical protein
VSGYSNPFQVTNPVAPGEVIDRGSEAASLIALANEGNNARLVAPRRYGKTSLLRRVQTELDGGGEWITVYVDLLGIVTLDDLAGRVERAYILALKGPIARWFTALRRTLRPTLTLGAGPVPASGTIDLGTEARKSLIDRLALPVKVHEKTGLRVHVVFDEFQELDEVDGQADAVVRSEIQHHGDAASYVFAGSRVHMMEMLFANRKRAFYGQTQPVHLGPLDPVDLTEYIVSRFQGTEKEIAVPALDGLLDLVAGHPQRAMVAAHALWDATETSAGLEEWETARGTLMLDVIDELRTAWLGLNAAERQALLAIARSEGPYSQNAARSRGGNVAAALKRLVGLGTIVRLDDAWAVVDPLLAEWLRAGRH